MRLVLHEVCYLRPGTTGPCMGPWEHYQAILRVLRMTPGTPRRHKKMQRCYKSSQDIRVIRKVMPSWT
jgi:hypothetical protein